MNLETAKFKKEERGYRFYNMLVYPAEYTLPVELSASIVTSIDEHSAAMKAMEPFVGTRRVSTRKVGEGSIEEMASMLQQYIEPDPPEAGGAHTATQEQMAAYLKDHGWVCYKKKK